MGGSIIVACDRNFVIGKENKLPWRVPEDLKLFRERTMGHVIIMGHNTWVGLPKKPLDGRINVVLSKSKWEPAQSPIDGPFFFSSFTSAIESQRFKYPGKEVFIIGGAQVYRSALEANLVEKIIMSKIDGIYDGDVFFPKLGKEWQVQSMEKKDKFAVFIWEKVKC